MATFVGCEAEGQIREVVLNPSACSRCPAPEVIRSGPGNSVPEAAASTMNLWGFYTISCAMQIGLLLNISMIFIRMTRVLDETVG